MSNDLFGPLTLAELRNGVGVTQTQMATYMGMPLRSYQDIEAGKNPVRPIHEQAVRYALLRFCAEGVVPFSRLPWDVQETVKGIRT